MTTRRTLLGQLAALLVGGNTASFARTPRARIGWLALSPPQSTGARKLGETLALSVLEDKGWVESRNLVFEVRGPTAGKSLAAAASELVALGPDVLASSGTPAIRTLRDATAAIPIVMFGAGDPVGTGLVASLARPGGNVTGVSWRLDDLIPTTLGLVHELVPRARRIDLVNQAGDPGHPFFEKVMRQAASARGLATEAFAVKDEDDLVSTIAASRADALLMLATQMIYRRPERIAGAAVARGLPVAITGGPGRDPTAAGILCSYCANQQEIFRRAGDCVDRILRGAKPADIPVEQPRRYDFIVNLATARAMGLAVPHALLLRADEVIE